MKTLLDRFKEIQKIGLEVEIPFYNVSRLFFGSSKRKLYIFGNQVELGGEDSDFCSIDEARTAIEWYVEQFGGKVKWSKVYLEKQEK